MIGTNVRGFRHLWRLSGPSLKEVLINYRDYGYCFSHVMKTDKKSPMGERLIIFNNHYNWGHTSVSNILSCKLLSESESKLIACTYSHIIEFDDHSIRAQQDFPYIYDITMLPDTFEEDYHKFLSANAKMIRTLTNKYGYDVGQAFSKRAYMYTDGSKNFYQWAISCYFQNGTSMTTVRRIMLWNEIYGQLAKNLQKNTITAYTSGVDMLTLPEELRLLRREKRVNDVINIFNTAQKKILREAELSDKDKDVMSSFFRLSEIKKVNFVRKMSTVEDFAEIMRQMRHITTTHFDWNKDSFMDFLKNVEGMKYETVFDNGDVVLVKVEDYETIKNLAKTTSWCISKNKTYWNNYVEHKMDSTQYMVFDFSKKEDDLLSIIGFTTEYNKGITHAHDFSNNDIMKSSDSSERQFLKSFVSHISSGNGIYNVLKSCGIDVNMVAQYDKPLYEWNKETMFNYLYECVNKSNVDILQDKGSLVAISVKDENVRYFLGDTYIDNLDSSNWRRQHIIFMDFSVSEYDPNRIKFAIINNQDGESEDYCVALFNEHCEGVNTSFETLLSQYQLPYNIIRRSDNVIARLQGAFFSYNAPVIKELLGKVDGRILEEVIYDCIGSETVLNIIASSVVDSASFDMLDAFYDNKIKLSNVFESGNINSLTRAIMNSMLNHGRNGNMDGSYKLPTEEEIKQFFNSECDSIDRALYICCYLALKKIISNEKGSGNGNAIYRRISISILMARKPGEVFEDLLMDIADQLNFATPHDTVDSWVKYANVHGSEKMKEYAREKVLIYDFPKKVWDSVDKHKNEDPASRIISPLPHIEEFMPQDNGDEHEDFDFMDDDEEFAEEEFVEGNEEEEFAEEDEPAEVDAGPF